MANWQLQVQRTHRRNLYSYGTLAAVAAFVLACGGRDQTLADSVAAAAATAKARAAVADSANLEPHTGLWTDVLLRKRLGDAGLNVRVSDTLVEYPYMSVKGSRYRLSRGELEVFLYPDSISAKRDAAGLDSATAAPPGTVTNWNAAPTLLRSINLVAIYISNNQLQIERVSNAITAGLMPPTAGKE